MSDIKLVVVENGNKQEYVNKTEMKKNFFGDNFEKLNSKEKYNVLKQRTELNATFNGIKVIDILNGDKVDDIKEPQYILLDEETFFVSLAKNNDIVLYEEENSNEFAKQPEKAKLTRIAGKFVRINDCANLILERKIKEFYKNKEKNEQLENENTR